MFNQLHPSIKVHRVWFPVGVLSSSTERSSQCVEALQPAVREEAVRLDLVAAASCGTEVGQHGLVVLPLRRLPPVFLVVIPLRTDKNKACVYFAVVGILSLPIKRFAWVLSAPPELKRPCGFHTSKYFSLKSQQSCWFCGLSFKCAPQGARHSALWIIPCHTLALRQINTVFPHIWGYISVGIP